MDIAEPDAADLDRPSWTFVVPCLPSPQKAWQAPQRDDAAARFEAARSGPLHRLLRDLPADATSERAAAAAAT